MKTDWDVIVAGAGPAGAMAAMRLAAAGVDVLLLDKARFPRDKPCGGGLTPKAFRQLDFDIGDLVRQRSHRLYLKGPHLAPIPITVPNDAAVWMVNRQEFDARLVQVARERGAIIRDGEGVTKIEPGDPSVPFASGQALARVETDRGAYRARVVIGADGAESIVARQVGLRADRHRRYTAFALEAEARVARDVLGGAALVDYRMPRGYGWIFPKGEVYNIGVGSGDPRAIRALRAHLDKFIAERNLPIVGPVRVMGHRIPVWSHDEPLHRANVLLAGDAAGLTDALWGEGISYAMMSGQIAALSAWDYLAHSIENLDAYTARVHNLLTRDLRRLYRLAYLVYGLPGLAFPLFAHSPWMQKMAAEIVSGDRSPSSIWRCTCALKLGGMKHGSRCDAVLANLAPGCR